MNEGWCSAHQVGSSHKLHQLKTNKFKKIIELDCSIINVHIYIYIYRRRTSIEMYQVMGVRGDIVQC